MGRAKWLLRIGGPVLFFVVAFRVLDRNFFVDAFSSLTAVGLVSTAIAVVITILLGTIRWGVLLHAIGHRTSAETLVAATFVGQGLNVMLPTGMIGDVIKVFLVSDQERTPLSEFLGSVVLDRVLGLAGFLFVAMGALLATDLHGIASDSFSISPGLLGIALPIACIAAAAIVVVLDRRLPARPSFWRNGLATLSSLLGTVYGYRKHRRAVAWGFLISILGVIPVCVALWFLARPFAMVPPAIVVLAVTGSTLINVLPISVNGLGSRDLVFIFFLGAAGVSAEQAVVLSLSWFLITFLVSVAMAAMTMVFLPNVVSMKRLKALLKK